MKKIIKTLLPNWLVSIRRKIRMAHSVESYKLREPAIIKRIKTSEKTKVVFFVLNVGMWKCDDFFKLLLINDRFEPIVVSYLLPIDSIEYRKYAQSTLRAFFLNKGYPYEDSYSFERDEWLDIKSLNPDIVFYPQPYDKGFQQYNLRSLWDKCLFVYIPYCYQMEVIPEYHNLLLQNICWKMFYPTLLHKQLGERYAYNKGKNIVVTGYPMTDSLVSDSRTEWAGWKQKDSQIKRIIWAPHHSIMEGSTLHNSNFLELADLMIQLAKEYQGRIQFAFKPHPRLITQLQKHPSWGEKRTAAYYQKWAEMPNTIFVEGEYTDLFKSSDALVHDCSSFMGEYLNTRKPLMFVARHNPTEIMNDFGKDCYDQHYVGKTIEDIHRFIDEVVIKGNDPMQNQREVFFNTVLKPPFGKPVAENMYQEMLEIFN